MTVNINASSSIFINSENDSYSNTEEITMDSWVIAVIDNNAFNFIPKIYGSHEEAKTAASVLSKEMPGQSIMIFRAIERVRFMKYEN